MNFKLVKKYVYKAATLALNEDLRGSVSQKAKNDFVTEVDLGISRYLKEKLKKISPSAGFFSEEEEGKLSDPCWILDPIDGTTNLVYGIPFSSVSLAYYEKGSIVFGIVYNPFSRECFTAEKGKGSYLNGRKLSVSKRRFDSAIIEFGAGATRKDEAELNFSLALSVFKDALDIRRTSSSALSLSYIAAGRIDGFFERKLKPWDYAAASLILEEAGGKISDFKGNQIQFDGPTTIMAGNGIINEKLLNKISENIVES